MERFTEAVSNASLRTSLGVSAAMTFGAMGMLFVALAAVVALGVLVVVAVPGLSGLIDRSDTAQTVLVVVGLVVYVAVALPGYFWAERAIGRAFARRRPTPLKQEQEQPHGA